MDQPLPKVPVEVGVIPHWLAINGLQPAIPENEAIQPRRIRRPKADAPPAAAAQAKPHAGTAGNLIGSNSTAGCLSPDVASTTAAECFPRQQ